MTGDKHKDHGRKPFGRSKERADFLKEVEFWLQERNRKNMRGLSQLLYSDGPFGTPEFDDTTEFDDSEG